MSRKELKYDNLPKLQKKIVLCLAKEGPMIMRETNRKIKGEYSSTNRAFHELEAKEVIRKVETISYRGREFSKYWLTVKGLASALLYGSNPEIMRKHALSVERNNEDRKAIDVYFDFRSLGPKIANVLDRFTLLVGKSQPEDLIRQLLPELVSMKENDMEEVFRLAKKTDYWKHTEKTLRQFNNKLGKALSHE